MLRFRRRLLCLHGAVDGRKVWNKTVHSADDYGGASCDIFVIVLFTTFLGMVQGQSKFVKVCKCTGFIFLESFGSGNWLCFVSFFETAYKHQNYGEIVQKLFVLGVSFLLTAVEGWLDGKVAVSGL
ncbi:MAG: hypothetical protein ACLSD6_09120 [Clostridium sp.]